MRTLTPPPPPPSDEIAVPAPPQTAAAEPVKVELETKIEPKIEPVSSIVKEEDAVTEKTNQIQALPIDPLLSKYVLSEHYANSIIAVKKNFNLSDAQVNTISDLDRFVFTKELDIESYLAALEDELKDLTDEQRDQLYGQLLAERFVPLGDFLKPTALEVAQTDGLKLPPAKHYRIYFQPLTFSGCATEVATSAGFSLAGGPMRERLRELIMSKLKGVRVDQQVTEMLTRGLDFGGLGLDPKTADKALKAMSDILKRAKVISEDEFAIWLADQARAKQENAEGKVKKIPLTPDEQEIENIQANMPRSNSNSELDKAVETVMGRLTYHPDNEYLAKRLRNVVSSRLRDVRSAIELKQLLMRDSKVGGMGLKEEEADPISKQIETAYGEFHVSISKEEKSKIEVQLEEQKRKIEERRKREAEEHAKWFEEKIRSRKAGEAQKTQIVQDLMGVAKKDKLVETAKFGPLVSPVEKTTAKTDVKPTDKKAMPSTIKVSPATVVLSQAKTMAKPSMDGVVYGGPQLVGLVGELKTFSLAEFRRLGKNPQDSIKKVQEKIETLAQESFEKRSEGVRAFQGSPLQASYMALVGESFRSGKPVVALAEEKRKAGTDTLSPDEIGAIIQLNSALHF